MKSENEKTAINVAMGNKNMMWIFHRAKTWLEGICLAFLMISAASLIFTGSITGKATIFGIRPMIVTTDSMLPTLSVGEIIIGMPVEPEEIGVGDIVAYRAGKRNLWINPIIVHRIVAVTDKGFIFQGDNNAEPDAAVVTEEQILFKIIPLD